MSEIAIHPAVGQGLKAGTAKQMGAIRARLKALQLEPYDCLSRR